MKFSQEFKTSWQLGFRNIWREKKRSLIILSATAFGAFGMIAVLAFLNGIMDSMITTSIQSGLGYVQIRPEGYQKIRKTGMVLEDAENILKQLDKSHLTQDHINYAPRFEREGFLRLDNRIQGVNAIGVIPGMEKKVSFFNQWIIQGHFFKDEQAGNIALPTCVIGKANADKFEVGIGDKIVLSIGDEKGESRSVRLKVVGIFQSTVEPVDKHTVLMKKEDLTKLYHGNPESVSCITFSGIALEKSEALKARILKEFQIKKAEVLSYNELEPLLTRMLDMSYQSIFIFELILMLGFGLILFDTVLISVMERTFEIGILRAIGTKGAIIFRMIILESVFLTLLGSMIGMVIGIGALGLFLKNGLSLVIFSKGLELMGKTGNIIYPYVTLENIGITLAVSFFVSLIAGIYPSWKAVKIIPARALSYKK